ncbi:MAG TPA: polymer-forming cytoskeletal protein [Flavobacteriaceae bacterium]|nr:polymer-forming cytoskeletal protein [Flavobacteriaceae bacterium]
MFQGNKKLKRKAKGKSDYSKEQNRISQNSVFKGDIESEGSFRIEGTLKGNLKTTGKVVLSESGKIIGDVECSEADIEGSYEGSIVVAENLNLKASANIEGDVITGKLIVEPGANLNGTCTMKEAVKKLKNEREKKSRSKQKAKPA